MKINIQLTAEDYVKANYLHLRPRPFLKWTGYFLIVLALAVTAMSFVMAITQHDEITVPIIIVGGFAYFWFLFGYSMPRRNRKTFWQQKALQLPHSYELTDEFVMAKAEHGESKMTWDFFRKWKEGKSIFTIYQSDRIMQMIPKRCFTSPEEMTQFRELLTRKIGPAFP